MTCIPPPKTTKLNFSIDEFPQRRERLDSMTIFDLCSAAADGHAYVCSSFIWFQEQSIDHHSDRRAPLFLLFYKTPVNEMMIMCCILDETKRKMDDDDVYTIISYNIIFF
jgi:hypothetical protein